jgi:hypothetical protein
MAKQPKFNPFAQYEVNEDHEVTGVWLVDPFHRMRVARAGGRNEKFNRVYEAVTKPYKRAIQTKTLPADIDKRLMREVYAKGAITGWSIAELDKDNKPVRNEQGEIVWIDGKAYHPETFEVVDATPEVIELTFEKKPELFSYVVERANDVTTYRDEETEEADVGN